ncbi:hypothetical protein Vafri_14907 [Volvox africanus]|uniref:Uncharacterized protein n=1 Tax=Volvox africanus TaxID=51714 RepID=A0A8J4BEB7_9CHLO|nr:hypothetical protein Vafri_14907 [Volvox africanus]
MVLAVEVVPFQRTMGEYNATSTNTSIDVNTILRNLKLRRESCTNIAASELASPDYDNNLPARTQTISSQPLTRPGPGLGAALGEPAATFSSGANVANEASGAACTDATDTVMGRRHRQYSAHTNPISSSATGASVHHPDENHPNDLNRGEVNPTYGKTVSPVPSLPSDGRARDLSATLPLRGVSSAVSPPPPFFGMSFLSSPSSLPLPPPPPLNGLYGIAHEDARFAAAPAHVDATAEVTMLISSASAPAPSHLVAALSPFSSSKTPAVPLPLKAISSSVLPLGGDSVGYTTYYPPHLAAAAVNARSYGNTDGKAAAALHHPVWGQSSGWQLIDVRGSDGKGGLAGDDRGSAGGGGGAGLESGGGSSCGGVGGSHCASPSLRLGGVAATAFAAASAIVAATSAAATAGGRGAAAVAAAMAEAARDVADSAPGRQSPPTPPRSPKASSPSGEAAPPLPGVLVTAVSSPSRSGPQLQGGPSISGDSFPASQRRISLEHQISRLKGSLATNMNGAVTTTNGQVNGYIDCYGTGAAASIEGALANEPANLGRTVSGAATLATAATVSVGAAAIAGDNDMLTAASAATAAPPGSTKSVNMGPSRPSTFGQGSPRQECRTPALTCLARTDGSSGGGGSGKSSSSGGGTAVSGSLSTGSYRGMVLPPSASLPVPPSYGCSSTTAVPYASAAAGSTSSLATQRSQLLEELHAAHKRELALAEQLGRARAEVLELNSQLTRQTEASATAATAAAAEAATALELRSQLRKERADADEEIRRWRSRAAAAEEQLQTALTQLACLRSATAIADQYDRKSLPSAMMSAATALPALTVESVADQDDDDQGEGHNDRTHLLPSPAGPSSPPRRSSRSSLSELDATPQLRRSLSYQALCLESGIEASKPPRAVSTSGGAKEEGDGCSGAVDAASAGIPGDGHSSGGGGGGVPLGSPPILASAAATVAAAASFSSGSGGGGSIRPPRAAAATQSPPCYTSTPAASDGGDGSVASASITENGAVSYEFLPIHSGKVHGNVYGVSGDDGYTACTESAGGGWGNWTVAAEAAGDRGAAETTQVQMSHSVPTPSNMVAPAMSDGTSGEWGVRLEPAASANVPGTDAGSARRGSSKSKAAGDGLPAAKGALPADIAALAAVPEGADGTAVLQSASAQPAGVAAHGTSGSKRDAASTVLLVAEVERLKQVLCKFVFKIKFKYRNI